ncbi:MAG: bifunctional 3-(3-hydroxy-phenyl)propionate/3-hydroxycinnamic acid hydroxylase [Rhizobiales bacterium]|nr:bifunctional 3-(3-hydroxy-phenyl)propionate/3-hydroxycinnamic acid hydroxylase [Hyphomicrobiales bacterium]
MQFDVVIIGLGPVGAALANLLGLFGLKTMVLEREAAIYNLPRAVHFDDEVMRIFQAIGVAEEVAGVARINPGMRFVDADGTLLLDWPRPEGIGPNGWNSSYRFHQPDLEQILRRSLDRFGHVTTRLNTECTAIDDRGSHVEVHYRNNRTGETGQISAGYLVGCDGARSFVRQTMQAAMDDLGFRERWLVVDVLLKRPRPDLGDHTVQFCDPARPSTYVRCPENRRRWEISLRDDEDADEISTSGSVWQLLAKWLTPQDAELERKAVYEFRSVVAGEWRNGRLLLAGDAAHQTPPFMGQGLCAGIRDVSNLAWKLARCSTGCADDSLLDTYASERIPHVRQYIETAVRLGGLINTSATQEALQAAFPQADGSARMASIAPPLGPGLHNAQDPRAGRLFPQAALANGGRLDDKCGTGFALIVDEDLLAEHELDRYEKFLVQTTRSEPEIRRCLDQMNARAVLLRPDRYILGTADTTTELKHLVTQASKTKKVS